MSKSYKVKLYCFDKASRCPDNRASKWSLFQEPYYWYMGGEKDPKPSQEQHPPILKLVILTTLRWQVNIPSSVERSSPVKMLSVEKAFNTKPNTTGMTLSMYMTPFVENLLVNQIVLNCVYTHTHKYTYIFI